MAEQNKRDNSSEKEEAAAKPVKLPHDDAEKALADLLKVEPPPAGGKRG